MKYEDQVWKSVQESLSAQLSSANYTSWVKPLKLASLNQSPNGEMIAVIHCPTHFHEAIVNKRFINSITKAVEKETQEGTIVNLVVSELVQQRKGKQTTAIEGPLFRSAQASIDEVKLARQRIGIREDLTLDSFAVSSSNEMAHAAAVAVTEHFSKAYNPLFFHGGVGVGKTHLMMAVANSVLEKDNKTPMIYCTGEEFTNEIIEAIQRKTTTEFKKRYRHVRGLLVDDVQFIAGKTSVQEEFFHTFNAILHNDGQVILTSDRHPSEIHMLEDRLRSRFEAGLIVDIGQPDFELRAAITLIKARQRNLELSMEAAQTIAANIASAQALLGKSASPQQVSPQPQRPLEVLKKIADHFEVPIKQLRGSIRQKRYVLPRHIAMYILRMDYKIPLEEIGELFSGRDHTTVMHAVEKITRELAESETMRFDVNTIRSHLYV